MWEETLFHCVRGGSYDRENECNDTKLFGYNFWNLGDVGYEAVIWRETFELITCMYDVM